jgi:hypothetical protein
MHRLGSTQSRVEDRRAARGRRAPREAVATWRLVGDRPVRWVQIENTMPEHRKIASAGPRDALRLMAWHVAAICFADRLATDGRITTADLPNLLPAYGSPTPRDLRLLVKHGLWESRAPGEWYVHDFLAYQECAASRRKSRDASKQRIRALRADVTVQSADRVAQRREAQKREAQNPTPLTSSGTAEATGSDPVSLSLVLNPDSLETPASYVSAEDARRLMETRERLRRQRRADALQDPEA